MNIYELYESVIGYYLKHQEKIKNTSIKSHYMPDVYQVIFDAMMRCYEKYGAISLESMISIDKTVSVDAFAKCMMAKNEIPDVLISSYESMIIDQYKADALIDVSDQLAKGKIDYPLAMNKIGKLEQISVTSDAKKFTKQEVHDLLSEQSKILRFDKFKKIESNVSVEKHDFVILAGGTGKGKTAMALNLAYDLCKTYPVLYINIEMSESAMLRRSIAINTGVPLEQLKDVSKLSQPNLEKIKANTFYNEPFYFVNGSQTIASIRRSVGSFQNAHRDQHFIVFVDHIGRIGSKAKSSYERMTEVAMALRDISLDFDCTLFGLCQVSRRAGQKDEKPSLNLLRDSGEIEQSARKVLMLWDGLNGTIELCVLKNSEGTTGRIPMKFDRDIQTFSEIVR